MEPGTALAVVTLVIDVAKDLYEYYRRWQECDEDVRQLRVELLWTHKAFRAVRETLRKLQVSPTDNLDLVLEAVANCNEAANELRETLERVKRYGTSITTLEKVKAVGRKACYPFKKGTIDSLKDDLESCKQALDLAVDVCSLDISADTLSSLQRLDEHLSANLTGVEDALQQVLASTKGMTGEQLRQKNLNILQWIGAVDQSQNATHNQAPGTNRWFFEGPIFLQWLQTPGSACILSGNVGCGKSTIFTAAVEQLRSRPSIGPVREVVVSFICGTSAARGKHAESLLKSIIVGASPVLDLDQNLIALYEHHNASFPPTQPSYSELFRLTFELLANQSSKVSILIDALDEVPLGELAKLTSLLQQLAAVTSGNLHILVLSRPGNLLTPFHANDLWSVVTIPVSDVRADIYHYVKQEIDQHTNLKALPSNMHDHILDRLAGQDNDMFRWAKLQLDELKRLRLMLPKVVMKTLRTLPPTLDATYEKILGNLAQEDAFAAKMAGNLLKILTYARYPLLVEEMIDALAISVRDGTEWLDNRVLQPSNLLRLLPGMVSIVPAVDWSTCASSAVPAGKHKVDFAHFSVREYVTGTAIGQSSVRCFAADFLVSHEQIAKCCIEYLCITNLPEHHRKYWPFREYAFTFWQYHMDTAYPGKSDEVALEHILTKAGLNREFGDSHPFGDGIYIMDSLRKACWFKQDDPVAKNEPLYTPISTTAIRVLKPIKSRFAESPIRFSMATEELGIAPKYFALSYSWGAPSYTARCFIDGREVCAGPSLASLMQRIRLNPAYAEQALWVDSLSINQKDLDDKARAVLMMETIFAGAEEVVIGLDSGLSELETWAIAVVLRTAELIQDERTECSQLRHLLEMTTSASIYTAIARILGPRWFSRAWSLAEFYASSKANFLFANGDIVSGRNLEQFLVRIEDACAIIEANHIQALDRSELLRSRSFLRASLAMSFRQLCKTRGTEGAKSQVQLQILLFAIRHHLVTEPRDRFFAFKSLSPDLLGDNFRVNYSLPYEVYMIMSAVLLIEKRGLLGLFHSLNADSWLEFRLPTWAPVPTVPETEPDALSLAFTCAYRLNESNFNAGGLNSTRKVSWQYSIGTGEKRVCLTKCKCLAHIERIEQDLVASDFEGYEHYVDGRSKTMVAGKPALVPLQAHPGDFIAALPGFRLLYVMRPHPSGSSVEVQEQPKKKQNSSSPATPGADQVVDGDFSWRIDGRQEDTSMDVMVDAIHSLNTSEHQVDATRGNETEPYALVVGECLLPGYMHGEAFKDMSNEDLEALPTLHIL